MVTSSYIYIYILSLTLEYLGFSSNGEHSWLLGRQDPNNLVLQRLGNCSDLQLKFEAEIEIYRNISLSKYIECILSMCIVCVTCSGMFIDWQFLTPIFPNDRGNAFFVVEKRNHIPESSKITLEGFFLLVLQYVL